MVEILNAGETVWAEEVVLKAADGPSIKALLNAVPVRSEKDGIESYVITLQDMAALERLERLRTQFLDMGSRELRTPLATVKGSTTTLLRDSSDLDPAVIAQFDRIMDQQVDHMHALINDLLDVARAETGKLSFDPVPTSVAEVVDEARTRLVVGGARTDVETTVEAGLPSVMAQWRRVVQVLDTLLSGAASRSPQGLPIHVAAQRQGGHVVVSVSHQRDGIPAADLPHVFQKFFGLQARAHADVAGSRLGMAICKGIV